VTRVRLVPTLTALALGLIVTARAEAQSTVVLNIKVRDELPAHPQLDQVLRGHRSPPVRALFGNLPAVQLQSLEGGARLRARKPLPRLGSWQRIEVDRATDLPRLLAELNALAEVDTAYLAPAPAPPPGFPDALASPDFTGRQGYLGPAPDGLDARFARTQTGGDGAGVKLIDVEYSWLLSHEDLQLDGASLGGACDPFCADDHGTAVLGMLAGRANAFGVTGAVSAANPRVISPVETGTLRYNLPAAIAAAGAALGPGDVLLIEQQAVGPHGGQLFVPAEWDPAVFDAIRVVTQAGVIVVEAAGNGGENLDGADFQGRFDRSRFDSDAIIVGAGTQAHARSYFSSYGSRVDLQGWGCCVTSTGYGDLFTGGTRATRYTAAFAGTSSASAMVAGAAVAVQGFHKGSRGTVLAPDDLVALLRNTGTPQSGGATQPVGPFPNLRAALVQLGAQPLRATVTVAVSGTGAGSVGSTPAGIACSAAAGSPSGTCGTQFEVGTVVSLSATPVAGSVFTGWSGACGGTGACQLTVAENTTVTAAFDIATFPLHVNGTGSGSGSVASQTGLTPAVACTSAAGSVSGACNVTYVAGTVVTLTPTTSIGTVFDGWTGACTGTGACTVTMSQARSVTARFVNRSFALGLSGTGGGGGTIATAEGVQPPLSCAAAAGATSGSCTAAYPAGTVIAVLATAATGSRFGGWSGACTGTGDCTVTLDQARSVTATFDLMPFTLTVAGSGAGAGRVTADAGGIDCVLTDANGSGVCAAAFPAGTAVTLTAAASAGSAFTGWTGACTGTATCVVTVDQAITVGAAFALDLTTLTVAGAGDGEGSVAASPDGITCTITAGATTGTCAADYAGGTSVTLSATAAAGSAFAGWDGDCSGTAACVVSLDVPRAVTATFSRQTAGLRVAGAGNGSGSVASGPGVGEGLACAVTEGVAAASGCRVEVPLGGVVTLTATADPGFLFAGWGGAPSCSTAPSCAVTVSVETAVTARFIPQPPAGVAAGNLLGKPRLTPEQVRALDEAGNHNGRFDVGDYLALLDREGE
jgi:List-Bact-rpt repeat protein